MERNVVTVLYYEARNMQTGELQSLDVNNHTIEVSKDGGQFVTAAGAKAEILRNDGITGSGIYKYTPTDVEMSAAAITFFMSSSTANIKLTMRGIYTQQLGTPVSIDGAAATVAGMITKLADDNAGADFDATNDSLRMIRLHGDKAWLTGSGGSADKAYTLLSLTRTAGDNDGGVLADTYTVDGNSFTTGEVTSGALLQVDGYTSADAATETPFNLHLWARYSGSGTHYMVVQVYNYVDSLYEPVGEIPNSDRITPYVFNLNPQHIDKTTNLGRITLRFLHNAVSGNPNHFLAIDKALITTRTPADVITVSETSAAMMDTLNATPSGVAQDKSVNARLRIVRSRAAGDVEATGTTIQAFKDEDDATAFTAVVDGSGNRTVT